MKTLLKLIIIFMGATLLFLGYVQATYKQVFEAPLTGLRSSTDSTIIARGKYLVLGPAHCWTCHMHDPSKVDLKSGLPDMSGGYRFDLPFGTLFTPNITSDSTTGIGRYSDEQLAQAILYNIKSNKNALAPFMTYNSLSDEDVVAIISYLRSTRPVRKNVPENHLNIVGKILYRFLLKPIVNEENRKKFIKPDTTAAYGEYLAYSVTNCNGCHTKRSPTGGFTGLPFAGGNLKETENGTFVVPNLTPDPETGRIYHWTEQNFINRFRSGKSYPDEYMPWEAYALLSDNDLKAIYKFLKTLDPTFNIIEATFIPKVASINY
jgi:mono/diheme cytochrome c family protein